jgi:hypothetical protein
LEVDVEARRGGEAIEDALEARHSILFCTEEK